MRILCPVILPATCVVPPRNTKFAKRGAVGTKLVGHNGASNHLDRHSAFSQSTPADYNVFNLQRHLISRRTLRVFRDQAMLTWRRATVAA
jgi:hypothetical protein